MSVAAVRPTASEVVVDVEFKVIGTEIPADHGYALFSALSRILPDLHGDGAVGVHPISGRLTKDRRLIITDRSFLRLRVPVSRIPRVIRLAGVRLTLDGRDLRVCVPQVRGIEPFPQLYSRLVTIKDFTEPEPFLDAVGRQMRALGIQGEPALIDQPEVAEENKGKATGSRSPVLRRTLRVGDKDIVGFAVRVKDLAPMDSLALQYAGLGGRRRFGCGIFVPDHRDQRMEGTS